MLYIVTVLENFPIIHIKLYKSWSFSREKISVSTHEEIGRFFLDDYNKTMTMVEVDDGKFNSLILSTFMIKTLLLLWFY